MGYMPTEERIRRNRKKKWCAVSQTKYRENESQYLYSDCAYQREPEPHEFPHGIGLHYPIIPPKEVDYECENVCEDEAISLEKKNYEEIPLYMQPVTSSKEKNTRQILVFPHRHRPPFKQSPKKSLAEHCMILEPFKDLDCEGLDILQSCLTFESILDKLNTSGVYQHDSKARALALRLLLQLPPQQLEDLEGQPTTTGRVHNRVYLSAKGKHHRVLTPRRDTSIIEQMGRASAVTLLQKCLRGRALQLSIEKTRERWEESYEELNGFNISYQVDNNSGMELVTYSTEMSIVRAVIGQYISQFLEPLVIEKVNEEGHFQNLEVGARVGEGHGLDEDESDSRENGRLIIHR